MDRRRFLATTLAAGAALPLPRLTLAASDDGLFELTAASGQARLYGDDGGSSDLWLYNNQLPGPEIRVKRGERVRVRFINKLAEPTSVHWHGIRIDNAMDGVSGLTQAPVQPGESFDYDFIAPDAGTFWYHAHNMSWNQVPRGLAGSLIIEEDEDVFAPGTDMTLALSDWKLTDEGVLDTAGFGNPHDFSHAGRLGNWLTVNGRSMPDIAIRQGRWHRLRLINMSASRILDLEPARFGAQVIGLDGQVFDSPRKIDGTVQLSPAQRMDLVMRPEATGTIAFEMMTGKPFTVANFVVTEGPAAKDPLRMPAANTLPEPDLSGARTVPLVMEGGAMGRLRLAERNGEEMSMRQLAGQGYFWAFNGQAGMGKAPFFTAQRGETIILESVNDTAFPHAIHLHGHHFRVLERNGEKLSHPDWRDTYTTARGETVKIAFVTDNPGKWLVHCHMLGHATSGMRDWFEVT